MERPQEIPGPDNAYFAAPQLGSEQRRLEYNRGRIVKLGAAAALIATATLSLNHLANSYRAGNVTDAPKDTSVTKVALEDGAILRSEPFVQDKDFTNSLDRVVLGDSRVVVIPTEDGAYVTQNENGTWYGIKADDLTGVLDVNVENDKDGIVWINDDRASDTTDLE